jgi:drug/metabolite transporter (DMT)-like permease
MILIWGSNFSVIKYALREFPEISFNALRLVLASVVFLAAIAVQARHRTSRLAIPVPAAPVPAPAAPVPVPMPPGTAPDTPATPPAPAHLADATSHTPLSPSDWSRIVLLGVVGHFLYQLFFLGGVARTSVTNATLIFGCTPVTVAVMASVAGHERLTRARWMGVVLSLAGIYAVVGHGARLSAASFVGDALVFGGMVCWSLYSVVAQPLLKRHSPLVVTGWSMVSGTVLYLLIAIRPFTETDWGAISLVSWLLMAGSSLFALAFAYIVWYTAVQKIGSARTAIYSNLTPIVAMAVAWLWLGEHIGGLQIFGAGLILSGIAVTRLQSR